MVQFWFFYVFTPSISEAYKFWKRFICIIIYFSKNIIFFLSPIGTTSKVGVKMFIGLLKKKEIVFTWIAH
jgi:hypothetical protein